MKKKFLKNAVVFLAILLLFSFCVLEGGKREVEEEIEYDIDDGTEIEVDWSDLLERGGFKLEIDVDTTYQRMSGFSASDAWNAAHIGEHWSETNKEQIAKWLFSQEFDSEGNPLGIGLSQWRVNFGAGSWEQGAGSLIGISNNSGESRHNNTSTWQRRAESFLADINNPKGATSNPLNPDASLYTHPVSGITYDFGKAAGQQYFFKKAKEMGVEQLIGFSNSPPVCWTINGWATNAAIGSQPGQWHGGTGQYQLRAKNANLKPEHYVDFAAYLADIADYWAGQTVTGPAGTPVPIRFNYISPCNEPQWEWNAEGQEGSPWTNAEIARIARDIDAAVQHGGRTNISANNTKTMISEAGAWSYTYGGTGDFNNQISEFFGSGPNSIAGLPTMNPRIIAGHSYWGHETDAQLKQDRVALANACNAVGGVQPWNTEWCALQGGQGLNNENFTYFGLALFMAKIIHADVALGNMASWSFWTAIDAEMWSHKNRFNLIGLYPGVTWNDTNSGYDHPITRNGFIKSQPNLWTLGNYSLFVRPGFDRIKISHPVASNPILDPHPTNPDLTRLMATAYVSPFGATNAKGEPVDRIVVVYVNFASRSYRVASEFTDGRKPGYINCYRTDEFNTGDNGGFGMRREGHVGGQLIIPARSVYTVVYDF